MPDLGALREMIGRRRYLLVAALVALLLVVTILAIVGGRAGRASEHRSTLVGVDPRALYPSEEPDFLPSFIPYAEPTADWSDEVVASRWMPLSTLPLDAVDSAAERALVSALEGAP